MRSLMWPALLCACAGLWAQVASAQAPAAETAPAFPELFRQAERTAPRLRELDATVDAAEGRARQAAAWTNPIAGVEVEDVSGTGPYRGSSQAQTTISLTQPLELAGQRGARVAAARATLDSAQALRSQARLDFAYELAVAYAAAEAAQNRAAVQAEDLSRAQEDVRSARALVRAGKEADLRAVQADAAAATAQAELDSARADLVATLGRLSSLAGRATLFSAVTPSLLNVKTTAATPSTIEAADTPSVRAAIAERNAAERRVIVERKRIIPVPSISVGTRHFAADDANAWVFSVALPLPIFDRNRGELAAARAELNAAQAREDTARLETQAAAQAAISQLHAAESRRAAADQAEAAAREAYRLARVGYEAGRTPLIELLSTRRTLTEAHARALEARVARVASEASLARLAGRVPFAE
jgi:cobalt-zinc-cadmium efflux system outer membrane protein